VNDLYGKEKPAVMIKATLDLIHEPGEVFEVRIPKTKAGTWSAYFNDTAVASILISKEKDRHPAIYMTVNPVNPALLSRNENKFEVGTPTTTTDSEIEKRRWFLLDFDPVRPAGISSTDGELALANMKCDEVRDWLSSIGWPAPIKGMSGNGYHLMYRVDLPNTPEVKTNVEFATKMLATLFSDDKVSVDTTVFNASRVWKIYGTASRKGSNTAERPHRLAALAHVPKILEILTEEKIDTVARALRDSKSEEFKDQTGEFIGDMVKWLSDRGQTVVSGPKPMFGNEGQKWLLSKCPFNHNHPTPMVGLVNNRPVYRCLHNSCSAFRWKEFREKIDPTYKDPDTIYNRLLEWCQGSAAEIDAELVQSACSIGRKLDPMLKRLRKETSRARVTLLEDFIKTERRRFQKEVGFGENTEKGNILGLIARTRALQADGIIPMFWVAEHDMRIRAGTVGDIGAPRYSEVHELQLMAKFHAASDTWVRQTHTSQVIKLMAEEYRVNALAVMLKSMKWDGVKRLDNWLHTYMGTVDNEYTRAIGRKWLISAVARGMEPGCQADHMLIFEGKQGIGKSRALRILGGDFYIEFSGILRAGGTGHKDLVATILGKQIIEMSELATLRRADMESLKALLTTTVDEVRLSYERDSKAYPRTGVFCGTTNEIGQNYIADQTGARRFWPTTVGIAGPVKTELLAQERDQLWAEAVHAYQEGEDWWTVPVDATLLEQMDRQMTLEQSEPWFDRIASSLNDPDSYTNGLLIPMPEFINGQPTGRTVVRAGSLSKIMGVLLGLDYARMGQNDILRVAKSLRTLGFKKVRPSRGWEGGTYAYDLYPTGDSRWVTIEAAIKASREATPYAQPQDEDGPF
jgi:hypothetical protein